MNPPDEPQNPRYEDRLLEILKTIPALNDGDNRTWLLHNLPSDLAGTISRHTALVTDLHNIITHTVGWGQLTSGERPLAIIARNALAFAEGIEAGNDLTALLAELEGREVPEKPSLFPI